MANPCRSRRLLSPHRNVRHDRDDRQPHLVPRSRLGQPFPDQSLRDALRGDRCILPDQDRPRRQYHFQPPRPLPHPPHLPPPHPPPPPPPHTPIPPPSPPPP